MSAAETQLQFGRPREVLLAVDLTDAELEAIARTEMDPRHRHLDSELE